MVELGPLFVRGEGAAELKARVLQREPAPGVAGHVELSAGHRQWVSVSDQVEGALWWVSGGALRGSNSLGGGAQRGRRGVGGLLRARDDADAAVGSVGHELPHLGLRVVSGLRAGQVGRQLRVAMALDREAALVAQVEVEDLHTTHMSAVQRSARTSMSSSEQGWGLGVRERTLSLTAAMPSSMVLTSGTGWNRRPVSSISPR